MSLYLVAYDLEATGLNLDCLSQKLEALGNYWRMQPSVWLVAWPGNAIGLANHLEFCLDDNDEVFVTKLTADSAWSYDNDATAWLRSNILK